MSKGILFVATLTNLIVVITVYFVNQCKLIEVKRFTEKNT